MYGRIALTMGFAARNTGVLAAAGRIIFFADADDEYSPLHMTLCYQALQATPGTAHQMMIMLALLMLLSSWCREDGGGHVCR